MITVKKGAPYPPRDDMKRNGATTLKRNVDYLAIPNERVGQVVAAPHYSCHQDECLNNKILL